MEGVIPVEKRLASGAIFRIMCSISESASTNKYKGPALRFVLAGESHVSEHSGRRETAGKRGSGLL
jgi:hypothetical protein